MPSQFLFSSALITAVHVGGVSVDPIFQNAMYESLIWVCSNSMNQCLNAIDANQTVVSNMYAAFNAENTTTTNQLISCMAEDNFNYPNMPSSSDEENYYYYNCWLNSKCMPNQNTRETLWLLNYTSMLSLPNNPCIAFADCVRDPMSRSTAFQRCANSHVDSEGYADVCNLTGYCQGALLHLVNATNMPPFQSYFEYYKLMLAFVAFFFLILMIVSSASGCLLLLRRRRYQRLIEQGMDPAQVGYMIGEVDVAPPVRWFGLPDSVDPEEDAFKKRLVRFLNVHNPQRLCDADDYYQLFRRRKDKFWDAMVKKYGPEPPVEESTADDPDGENAADNGKGQCSVTGTDLKKKGAARFLLLPCRCEWSGESGEDASEETPSAELQSQLKLVTNQPKKRWSSQLFSHFVRTGDNNEPEPFNGLPTPRTLRSYLEKVKPDVVPLQVEGHPDMHTCACKACGEPIQAIVEINELYLDLDGDAINSTEVASTRSFLSDRSQRGSVVNMTAAAAEEKKAEKEQAEGLLKEDDDELPFSPQRDEGGEMLVPEPRSAEMNLQSTAADENAPLLPKMEEATAKVSSGATEEIETAVSRPVASTTSNPAVPECCICFSNPCNVAFLGCGHLIACHECSERLREAQTRRNEGNVEVSSTCPLCRARLDAMVVLERNQVNTALLAAISRQKKQDKKEC